MTSSPKNSRSKVGYSLARVLLLPGEFACDVLRVSDADSRVLVRMFLNLTVYGAFAVVSVLLSH